MSTELMPESDITTIILKWNLLILSLALIYSLDGSSSFPQDCSCIHLYTFILMLFQKFLLCLEEKSLLLIYNAPAFVSKISFKMGSDLISNDP